MNIELKKVKTFQGREGYGLNAEVWVDGVKTAFVRDDASGSIFYDFTVYNKEKFAELEAYVKSLPAHPLEYMGTVQVDELKNPVMMEPTLEYVIDTIWSKQVLEKGLKKLEKKFVDHIIWGPKEFMGDYTSVRFKTPLAKWPTEKLQKAVDTYKETSLLADERFYNTNFEQLKIKV